MTTDTDRITRAKVMTGRKRRLHRGHFAFMRALVEGLDARASWDRYLRDEGDSLDTRLVNSTIAWIRDAFAAAARRQSKFGTARLVLVDSKQGLTGLQPPSLAEFAVERGMEDFSEAEQAEAYAETYGADVRKQARRARLITRQLDALRWLEELVAQDPGPGDAVSAWLAPSLADRIERAGMPTLFLLAERINLRGGRWWTAVAGIGEKKGLRVVEWMRTHEKTIGVRIAARVSIPRSQISAAELNQVVLVSTALVPLEKFRVPAELDGGAGRFRAQPDQCLLEASNDYEALAAWLASKRGKVGDGSLSPTQRAYRKEGERLLLWSILERRKPLSSLTVEDVTAFCDFLQAPPPSWCGPRHEQRWSPLWRPLEGPLSPSGQRQAITILRSLFTFLVSQHYVIGNPFNAVALPRESGRMLGSNRTLSFAQWDLISDQLDQDLASAQSRRRARAMRWLYATGLRTAEITAARCGDLSMLHFTDDSGAANAGWLLTVIGKGGKVRQVPVPGQLVDELEAELQRCGYPSLQDERNANLPLLALFEGKQAGRPWTPSGLYKSLKAFLDGCSRQMAGQDAAQLRKASTHWLRHSHGSHALNGRNGHDPVAIQIVQNNLGHASIGTTSGYVMTELEDRVRAMQGFWKPVNRSDAK